MTPLLLASASPRRTAILTMLGVEHEILPAHVPEELLTGEAPAEHVTRLAREKAARVALLRPEALVLAADTAVVLEGQVLGKPSSTDDAVQTLLALSARTHDVLTALALAAPGAPLLDRLSRARVTFRPFGREEALAYAATGEPMDKAGAYGIQGLGAALVQGIEGDYYAVVGLPVAGLLDLLSQAGWRYVSGRGITRAPSPFSGPKP
jgi:septum formation protein